MPDPQAAKNSTGSAAPRPSPPWSTPNSASNTSPPTTPATSRPSPKASATASSPASGSSTRASTPTPSPPSTTRLYHRTLHCGWPDVVLTPGVQVRTAGRIATSKVELHLEHLQQDTRSRLTTDAVVLATGYRERPLDRILAGLDPYLRRDSSARPRVDEHFRLALDPSISGSDCHIYVQNAERHTHGVGTPDLGLAAWRSATILNSLTGKETYPLPTRTAFTTFGLDQQSQPRIPHARHAQVLTPLVDKTPERRS